nr:sulfatase-like hydrolase/transferase [Alicyclobacillus fastidiosus]
MAHWRRIPRLPLSQLPKHVEWLPEILRKAGFVTGAVDNLYQLKEWFARGYRYYINSVGRERWIDGRTVNDLAIPWIREHKDEDFFLFLHYWDCHTPYLPPLDYVRSFYDEHKNPYDSTNQSMKRAYNHPAYPFFKHHHYSLLGEVADATYVNALYDAEVRYLDDRLRELDECLREQGVYDDTLLILFGDHGESLTEHDIYWDHCGLYDSTVHVPMILRWPNRIPPRRRVSGLVQQVDLMPTVLEALCLNPPRHLDGKSLWPAIDGLCEQTHARIYLSECAWQASRGVRTSDYKFIQTIDSGPFVRPPCELYDLRSDPNETNNLVDLLPEKVLAMAQLLNDWVTHTLDGREDPMNDVLRRQGLPFRRRIEQILCQVGLTWNDWLKDPSKRRFDELYEMHVPSGVGT